MTDLSGWLLDIYPEPKDCISLWLLGDDGKRYRLEQVFPVTFYIAGTEQRLQAVSQYLRLHPLAPRLERTERRELFHASPIPLLAVETNQPDQQMRLFYQILSAFPDLAYYDVDVSLTLRHAARFNTFPLARCSLQIRPGLSHPGTACTQFSLGAESTRTTVAYPAHGNRCRPCTP